MGPPPPAHLRQEILLLGGRHLGDALQGAKRELEVPGLTRERRRLLEAVVRHLEARAPTPAPAPVSRPAPAPTPKASVQAQQAPNPPISRQFRGGRFTSIVYGAVCVMLMVWGGSILIRLLG